LAISAAIFFLLSSVFCSCHSFLKNLSSFTYFRVLMFSKVFLTCFSWSAFLTENSASWSFSCFLWLLESSCSSWLDSASAWSILSYISASLSASCWSYFFFISMNLSAASLLAASNFDSREVWTSDCLWCSVFLAL
jgi:hypothetical protein